MDAVLGTSPAAVQVLAVLRFLAGQRGPVAATVIARELRLLLEPPAPTKLSLHLLCKASAAEPKDVPAWAQPHLPAGGDPLGLLWQPSEVREGAVGWLRVRPGRL